MENAIDFLRACYVISISKFYINYNYMYKKILSLLSVFALFASMAPSVAFADVEESLITEAGVEAIPFNPAQGGVSTISVTFDDTNAELATSTGYIKVLKGGVEIADDDGLVVEWGVGVDEEGAVVPAAIPAGPYTWDGMCGEGDMDYCDDAADYTAEVHVEYADDTATEDAKQEETVVSAPFALITPISGLVSDKESFNPLDEDVAANHATLTYTTAEDDTAVLIEVLDAADTVVRTLLDNRAEIAAEGGDQFPAGTHTVDWDGKNAADPAVVLDDGEYKIRIRAFSDADPAIAIVDAVFIDEEIVSVSQLSTVFTITDNPHDFIPVTDTTKDIEFYYELGVEPTSASLKIENEHDAQMGGIQTVNAAKSNTFEWSGQHNGKYVEPGTYTATLTLLTGTAPNVETTTLTKDFVVAYTNTSRPGISGLSVTPVSFDPDSEIQKIIFTNTRLAKITVEVRNADGLVLREFPGFKGVTEYAANTSHEIEWDGYNNTGSTKLGVGDYNLVVVVSDVKTGVSMEEKQVSIDDDGIDFPSDNAHIDNIKCTPSSDFEPGKDDDMECEADTEVDNVDLKVFAVRGNVEIELYNEDDIDEGKDSVEFTWDGTDDDDEYVDAGTWRIEFRSQVNGRNLLAGITRSLKYQKPSIDEFLLSKKKIDNDIGELTYALVKLNDPGRITLNYMVDNDEDDEIVEEMEVEEDKWYAIEINGDGFDYDDDMDIQLLAANEVKEDENNKKKVSFDLAEEKVSSTKSNVTHDYIYPVATECDEDLEIGYTLDDTADVVVSIHKGKTGSGSKVIEIANEKDQEAGDYNYTWDCKNSSGTKLSRGFYTYKIVSKDRSTETEEGIFVVGVVGNVEGGPLNNGDDNDPVVTPVTPVVTPVTPATPVVAEKCAGFTDVNENSKYCSALSWARESGVIEGYADGKFGLYDPINRVELLKVALEATGLGEASASSTLGYTDVIPGAWYMGYLKRGQELGVFVGDAGRSTARPGDGVNKVESLKIVLESLKTATTYKFGGVASRYSDVRSGDWYFTYVKESDKYGLYDPVGGDRFAPSTVVNRAEVVQMLYRLHLAGLL